jgi:hypothetical protein
MADLFEIVEADLHEIETRAAAKREADLDDRRRVHAYFHGVQS